MIKQKTEIASSRQEVSSNVPDKLIMSLPKPAQRVCFFILNRSRDPQPEVFFLSDAQSKKTQSTNWGWTAQIALCSALGLALIAYGFILSHDGGPDIQTSLYPGLLLIFTPIVLRLTSPMTARTERVWLLCIAGISCYFIKAISNPLHFSFPYDEFLHWRTAEDILRSQHLFTPNSLLPVSPYYPGLEIVTNAISTISGLDTFHSGLIVIGVARLLMILALFALNEHILQSARAASIATIIYIANPHFLLFDSQFAYESLALPLAIFVMFVLAPHQPVSTRLIQLEPLTPFVAFSKLGRKILTTRLRWVTLTTWIALLTLVVTHHVTSFFLIGLLVVWTLVYGFLRFVPLFRSTLAWTTIVGVFFALGWIALSRNPVVGYISSFIANAIGELSGILLGSGSSRPLFVSYNGQSTSLVERGIILLSVLLILSGLPFGLISIWQRYRTNALVVTLGIVSLFYPVSQVFRFSTSGAQLTDRSAAFLFIGISTVLAIFIVQFWPLHSFTQKKSVLLTGAISILFLGGIILGIGPGLSSLPGPYAVGADSRSVGLEGIEGASWTANYLGSNNRVGTDRTDQTLMGTYGDQHAVTTIADNIDVSPVFFSQQFGVNERAILKKGQVHYLVVDLRLSQGLPLIGVYFVEGEPDAYHHTTPIAIKSLTKFNTLPQINKVFDSGNIIIYDTEGIVDAQ